MRIIHIGDIHLYRLGLAPWHLLSKRILGQSNLWLNRRKRILCEQIGHLTQRVMTLKPDVILFSGDLTVTALHTEFQDAYKALEPLLKQHQCFMTPGNHDRYTYRSSRTKRFEHYFKDWTEIQWPGMHRLSDNLVLITLDPTRPNRFNASGLFNLQQRSKLENQIKTLAPSDKLLMLCHYDLGDPPGYKTHQLSHGLLDKDEFLNLLPDASPMLYMHGHVHHPWLWRPENKPNLSILNAGAAIMTDHGWLNGQGFWEINIIDDPGHCPWRFIHHHSKIDQNQWCTEAVNHTQAIPAYSPSYM